MDFKWTLSRPGITLEFETGSVAEAIGLLEQEGTQISTVFGFTMGAQSAAASSDVGQDAAASAPPPNKPDRKPRAAKVEAVAPAPLPVPTATLPPNTLNGAAASDDPLAIPANLRRDPETNTAPALAGPALAPPPLPVAPTPPPTPPPVGVLGPKVVFALDAMKKSNPADEQGSQLSDWLAATGLTQKGATYDDACRVVLMTSDAKLTELGIPAAILNAA